MAPAASMPRISCRVSGATIRIYEQCPESDGVKESRGLTKVCNSKIFLETEFFRACANREIKLSDNSCIQYTIQKHRRYYHSTFTSYPQKDHLCRCSVEAFRCQFDGLVNRTTRNLGNRTFDQWRKTYQDR